MGTRPDCLPPPILNALSAVNRTKPVWVELGLQTIHPRTARAIHRGYDLPVFERAYRDLTDRGIAVGVHVIVGLPGDSRDDMLALLPEQTAIHRLTGDGPKRLLIAPVWSADKRRVMNALRAAIARA